MGGFNPAFPPNDSRNDGLCEDGGKISMCLSDCVVHEVCRHMRVQMIATTFQRAENA